MANIASFLVMNYLKRKEKEEKKRHQDTVEKIVKDSGNEAFSLGRYRIKLPYLGYNYDDLPEDVKDLIEFGVIELET